jgi:uncharacterized protein (DUF1684 family)
MSRLDDFRRAKDHFFAHNPQSPLTATQREQFRGLAYFPENPALVIHAELEESDDHAKVSMPTSDGALQIYRRAGRVRFAIDGREGRLTLFASDPDHGLFLPFRDGTSGRETYGAGRYLDVGAPTGGRVVVDFNYAYNPSCAYNEQWSCPLPPAENWLSVPIRAGEQRFQDGDEHERAGLSSAG